MSRRTGILTTASFRPHSFRWLEKPNELFEKISLEVMHHLFAHQFQGDEGRHFFPIGPVRRQGVINVGDGADAYVNMNIIAAKPLGVARAVNAFVVLHDDDSAFIGQLPRIQ